MKGFFFTVLIFCTLMASGQEFNWGYEFSGNLDATNHSGVHATAQFANGDVLLVGGFTDSLQFGSSSPILSSASNLENGFMVRIDTNGTVVWGKVLEGNHQAYVTDVAVGSNDTIFITGVFDSQIDLDPSSSSYLLQPFLGADNFLAKYDGQGNFMKGGQFRGRFVASKTKIAVGAGNDLIVAFKREGNLIVNGSVDLDIGPDSLWMPMANATVSVTICLVNYNFNFDLQWHREITDWVDLEDLNTNIDGDIHVLGNTQGDLEASSNRPGPELSMGNTAFWLSFTSAGQYKWCHGFGSISAAPTGVPTNTSKLRSLSEIQDPVSGDCFLFGKFSGSVDVDRTSQTYTALTNKGGFFVAKYDKDGYLHWAMEPEFLVLDMAVNTNNVTLCGTFYGTTDFNLGAQDSILSTGFSEKGYMATYDNEGQFLSVLSLASTDSYHLSHIFSLPSSPFLITIASSDAITSSAIIDLDPDTAITENAFGRAIASYTLPCVPAQALDGDSAKTSYSFCTNENVDIPFPRRASGYSQTIWEADTGTGFIDIDQLNFEYQLRGENLRILAENALDTTRIRGILSNSCGADTTDVITLVINEPDYDTLTHHFCAQDSIYVNGQYYFFSVDLTDSLVNSKGCDSIVTHSIRQVYPNTSILQDSAGLRATNNADAYQWLSCPDFTPIPNATNRYFYPMDTAEYAVAVTLNGCTDTTACLRSAISLVEVEMGIDIYPNPTSGILRMEIPPGERLHFTFRDMRGRQLESTQLKEKNPTINLRALPPAIYIIEIHNDSGKLIQREKLIKTGGL